MKRRSNLIISVCTIAIAVICAFAPAIKNDFLNWDDNVYVTDNIYISHISAANIRTLLTSSIQGTYQPVVNLTYLLERHFFGLRASFYHATNILLHALNCILVFWLILLLDGNIFVSLLAALLFGLHPLRVESVAWISERKDVLYSFFYLWALVDYCRYIKSNSAKYYYHSFFLFLLSLGSKAMAATLPLVFFAVDYLLKRRYGKKIILEKVPFFVLAFLFGLIALFTQGKALGLWRGESFVLSRQIAAPFYGIIMYLYKTVFPANLSLIYPYPPQNAAFYLTCLLSLVLVSLIAGGVVISLRFTRKVGFAFLFSLITILPVLQFIPIGAAIMADRYTYLPSMGICYLTSAGFFYIYRMKHRYAPLLKAALIIFLTGAIIALCLLTHNRTQVWKDSITMFNDVIKKHPDAYLAYNNRGTACLEQGNLAQAISDFNKCIEIDPGYAEAYNNRGNIYLAQGNFTSAISDYTKTLKISPNLAKVYNNRGFAYDKEGDQAQAISDYTKALEIDSSLIKTYSNRGIIYLAQGNFTQAISDFTRAVEITPNLGDVYHNRGIAYFSAKEYGRAWADVHKAEELKFIINPNFLDELRKASGRDR